MINLYKGFEITPGPQQLLDTGEWTMNLYIRKWRTSGISEKKFHAGNTFATREEAGQHCVRFAHLIIDGKSQNCTVDDL